MELKPCPFCGAKARVPISNTVTCSNTNCPLCGVIMHDTLWNTRDDSALREMDSQLKEKEVTIQNFRNLIEIKEAQMSRLKAEREVDMRVAWDGAVAECVKAMFAYHADGWDTVRDRNGEPEQEEFDIIGYCQSFLTENDGGESFAAFLSRKEKGE